MILTAHQPTYLPWLGTFHKILLADMFCFFDISQYQKKEWDNRNKIYTHNGELMLSVPTKSQKHFDKTIGEIAKEFSIGIIIVLLLNLLAKLDKYGLPATTPLLIEIIYGIFRLYNNLSGMTGTADTEAYEFQSIYGLEVIVIPTHKAMIRNDQPDKVYLTEEGKFRFGGEILVNGYPDFLRKKSIVAFSHQTTLTFF